MSAFEELKAKLKEIFQLDRNDLDFGLYRIMNLKAAEVSNFIDNELLPQVKEGLKSYSLNDNKAITEELKKAEEQAKELGMNPEDAPKVKELKAKLKDSFDSEKIENEIYSDLYNFFKRYYSEGDFLSLRRYKEGVYALPYEGEEVKLYWANADQYYIKSGETLTNYTFKIKDKKVRFEVVQATTEQNNNKDDKNRRFRLVEENPVRVENNEYIISFSYLPDAPKPTQDEINAQSCSELLINPVLMPLVADLGTLTGNDKNKIPLLQKYLNNFTAKNTFDYFIHKDLGKFLNRELDFYIKNEIMHLDDIEEESAPKVEQYLCKVKVLRKVARKIITFLASLEDFQKKIWLKKKFVLETNYCITLDRVPEELYPTIIANEAQIKEWIKLFAIDELKGYSKSLTIEFLKANPYLVLDTAFFDADFKYKLLASIDDFDEQCDGLLIHSENFQALSLLQEKYRESIKCIYIDPPYNAKSSEIAYKNSYKHSSWLSLISNRVMASNSLQYDKSVFICAIDEMENDRLGLLLADIYTTRKQTSVGVIINPSGQQGKNFSTNHEILHFIYEDSENMLAKEIRDEDTADVRAFMNGAKGSGNNYLRESGKNCFYPIIVNNGEIIRIEKVCSDDFHPGAANVQRKDGSIEIYPIDSDGVERKWLFARDTVDEIKNELSVKFNKRRNEFEIIRTKNNINYKTLWTNKLYNAKEYGTNLLKNILPENVFTFPKSIYAVLDCLRIACNENKTAKILDYFAGSGTTGHAVINLNREDGGKRKYILVEMGNYFDLVTKPRIEKVIYSKDWKDGKPVSREGSSHCFKYIRLESYEDALDNLQFERTTAQTDLLNKPQNKAVKEEYMLKYMMDLETKGSLLNINQFSKPFDYELKITRNGETKTVKVDLVETFNYLIGLNVSHIQKVKDVLTVEGTTREGEKTLILWRDTEKTSAEDLDKWFEKQNYSTQDMEFDTIYVNGNNNLENLRKSDETWKVRLIEAEFQKRMFNVKDV